MWSKVTSTEYWHQDFIPVPEVCKSIKASITGQPVSCLLIMDTADLAGEEDRTSVAEVMLDFFI